MVKRVVDTNFWTDMQVMDHYSVEDKYFTLYLLTNGKSTQVGIYALPKKMMSFETGFTSEVVEVLLDRFTKTYGKIVYSEKTQEITFLNSLEFSVLTGGKPVRDLLERELSKVKDGALILATYEAMLDFWQLSKRAFDQTIKELFEVELETRGFFQNENQNQRQNDSHNYSQSQNQHHNQESGDDSGPATRATSQTADEEGLLESYATYLKRLKPELKKELTADNLVQTFYAELIGDLSPHVETTLNGWLRAYPKSFILEALNRSLEAHFPLVYADEILKNWHKQGATCFRDIIRLDQEHSQQSV